MPAAVAIETLKIYDETDIGAHVERVGPHLQRQLARALRGPPAGGRGARRRHGGGGGAGGGPGNARPASTRRRKIGARLTKLGEDHGVILRALPGDSIAFSPPLVITEEEVDEMFDRFGRALDELTVQLRRESIAAV